MALLVNVIMYAGELEDNKASCENGEAVSCYNIGATYLQENKVKKAKSFLTKACDADFNLGCYALGVIATRIEKNYSDSIKYYSKACALGEAKGCKDAGLVYNDATTGKKDLKKAVGFYIKACNLGDALSCNNAGAIYEVGKEVQQDYKKALFYYSKGCKKDYAHACSNLGSMYHFAQGTAKDDVKAKALLKRACDGGSKRGCKGYKFLSEKTKR